MVGGIVGYVGPSMYIDRRISARKMEHRGGFPDFMDLLVVCADSGLSMEASFERVGSELGEMVAANRERSDLAHRHRDRRRDRPGDSLDQVVAI